jgi:hypothetical protein
LALVIGLVAGACGGADVPDGYARWSGEGASVAYPQTWTVGKGSQPVMRFTATSPRDADGHFARVSVQMQREHGVDLEILVRSTALATVQNIPGARVLRERDAHVPGADGARYIDARIGDKATLTHLLAVKGDDRQYDLTLAVPRGMQVDRQAIFESFTLEG